MPPMREGPINLLTFTERGWYFLCAAVVSFRCGESFKEYGTAYIFNTLGSLAESGLPKLKRETDDRRSEICHTRSVEFLCF